MSLTGKDVNGSEVRFGRLIVKILLVPTSPA